MLFVEITNILQKDLTKSSRDVLWFWDMCCWLRLTRLLHSWLIQTWLMTKISIKSIFFISQIAKIKMISLSNIEGVRERIIFLSLLHLLPWKLIRALATLNYSLAKVDTSLWWPTIEHTSCIFTCGLVPTATCWTNEVRFVICCSILDVILTSFTFFYEKSDQLLNYCELATMLAIKLLIAIGVFSTKALPLVASIIFHSISKILL